MNIVTGGPVSGSDFYPRQLALDWIWDRLPHSSLVLAAPRRSGKTSLMFQMRDHPKHGYHPLFFNVEADGHPAAFLAHMVDQLRGLKKLASLQKALTETFQKLLPNKVKLTLDAHPVRIELEKTLLETHSWEREGQRLIRLLHTIPEAQSIVFLVDEFPFLIQRMHRHSDHGPEIVEQFLHWFRTIRTDPSLSQGKVRFVVTGSIGIEGVLRRMRLSATFNDLDRITLEPFSQKDGLGLLEKLHQSQSRLQTQDPNEVHQVFQAMIKRLDELSPYYIQLFYKELRELAHFGQQPLSVALVKQTYEERMLGAAGQRALVHYEERLEKVLPDDELRAAHLILDVASERKGGIHLDKLYDRVETSALVAAEVVDPLLDILTHDGYLKKRGKRMAFRSGLLRDWWRGRRAAVRRKRQRPSKSTA